MARKSEQNQVTYRGFYCRKCRKTTLHVFQGIAGWIGAKKKVYKCDECGTKQKVKLGA